MNFCRWVTDCSSARNVPSSEERGETAVFAGYSYWISINIAGKNVVKLVTKTRQVWKWYACNVERRFLRKSFENLETFLGLGVGGGGGEKKPSPLSHKKNLQILCQSSINHSQIGNCVVLKRSFKWCWQIFANWSTSKLKNNSYEICFQRHSWAFLNPPQSVKVRRHWQFYYHYFFGGN